jgi:Cas6b C-terminal domain/Cas6b N-terminal domain
VKLRVFTLRVLTDAPIDASAAQLRGFFATKFNDYQLLHHHSADKLIYDYPRVQYKVIDGQHLVLGIDEGVEVLKEIYDQYESLRLGSMTYNVIGQEFGVKECELSVSDEYCVYTFKTPWLALNQANYQKFYACKNRMERLELLSRTLIGNLLSMSKSFGYAVPQRIEAVVDVNAAKTHLKGVSVMAFHGRFTTNFEIPELLGIGKSVSRGYGAVQKCN